MLRILFLLAICIFAGVNSASVKTVSDTELINLTQTEKYVIALFTRKNCEACDNYENGLIHIKDDLVDTLSTSLQIIKVSDSQLLKLYSSDKEPAIVFFRHGMPLLYNSPMNDEEILTLFNNNKEPATKELTDDTFEHLTQASSGATTGDWFVMFYSTDCVKCVRMLATWEAVAAKLKHRINVALINKSTTGASTARRFNVDEVPAFIFFRHGKMYRCTIPKHNIATFVSFAEEWYRNARAETVPAPQSPFDDLVQMIADFLRENPWVMKLGSMSLCVFIIISVASKFKRKSETPQKKD